MCRGQGSVFCGCFRCPLVDAGRHLDRRDARPVVVCKSRSTLLAVAAHSGSAALQAVIDERFRLHPQAPLHAAGPLTAALPIPKPPFSDLIKYK